MQLGPVAPVVPGTVFPGAVGVGGSGGCWYGGGNGLLERVLPTGRWECHGWGVVELEPRE